MLDCEKLVTSPASSQARTAPPTTTSRRRLESYAPLARVSSVAVAAIITSARKRP